MIRAMETLRIPYKDPSNEVHVGFEEFGDVSVIWFNERAPTVVGKEQCDNAVNQARPPGGGRGGCYPFDMAWPLWLCRHPLVIPIVFVCERERKE